jgi:hypothetical protein
MKEFLALRFKKIGLQFHPTLAASCWHSSRIIYIYTYIYAYITVFVSILLYGIHHVSSADSASPLPKIVALTSLLHQEIGDEVQVGKIKDQRGLRPQCQPFPPMNPLKSARLCVSDIFSKARGWKNCQKDIPIFIQAS